MTVVISSNTKVMFRLLAARAQLTFIFYNVNTD